MTAFSATGPMAGYLFQLRWALVSSIQRARRDANFTLSIEVLDDVAFEGPADATELVQLKHNLKRRASLTDGSSDLWKSLRVWIETKVPLEDDRLQLSLVTTATAPEGSAASLLRATGRNEPQARIQLAEMARTSTNLSNKSSYDAFNKLDAGQQNTLLERLTVVDAAVPISGLSDELLNQVRWVTGDRYLVPLVERLEGWWFRSCIAHLHDAKPFSGFEIEEKILDLGDQLRDDNLPIDDLDILLAELGLTGEVDAHLDKTFVHQLQLIGLQRPRLLTAVRDWLRAYSQRSRWLRDQLITGPELQRFEERLIDEWTDHFHEMLEDLGEAAGEEEMEREARTLYRYARQLAIRIKPRCDEPFVCRGSFHMLADDMRIGWHPEYQQRLEHLLEVAPA